MLQHTAIPKAAKISAVCTKSHRSNNFEQPLCHALLLCPLSPAVLLQPTDPHVHRTHSDRVLSCSSSALCLCLRLRSHGSTGPKVAHEPLCAVVWRDKFNASDGKPLSCGPPNYCNSIFPLFFMMFLLLTRIRTFFFFSANIHPVAFFQHNKVLNPTESQRAISTQHSCSQQPYDASMPLLPC